MSMLSDLAFRCRALLRRRAVESELDDELRFHWEQAIAEHLRAGRTRQEAERLTRLRFGGVEQVKDACREARGTAPFETLLRDLGYGLRTLRTHPGFTAVAVLTLALGIGANTALFSVVDGVLLKPLPFPDPDRLVRLHESKPNFAGGSISYPNFRDWQQQNHTFTAMAIARGSGFSLTGRGEAEQLDAQLVTSDYFSVLGVKPVLGRTFLRGEDEIGARPAVVVSAAFWRRKLGGSPDVLGQSLTLDGRDFPVVGVVEASFGFEMPGFFDVDVYVPVGQWTNPLLPQRSSGLGFHGIGRLAPGVTLAAARADLDRITRNLAVAYPEADQGIGATLAPFKDEVVKNVRPYLLVLLGAVGFVLLIACVNVANLLLARSTARAGEFAVRTALGASRGRLVRQLLTESLLLAVAGGSLGMLAAAWGTRAALGLLPSALPRAAGIGIDGRVLAFTMAISLTAGLLFGLVPALRTSRKDGGAEALKEGGRGAHGGRHRVQSLLVMAQMATAVVLLAGAGLMLRSLVHLWNVDPGFQPHQVTKVDLALPPALMSSAAPAAVRAAWRSVDDRLAAAPGVQSLSLTWAAIPLDSDDEVLFWPDGRPKPANENEMSWAVHYVVEPGYLRTMRIPLVRGRFFDAHDDERSAPVAVVDEVFARQFFGAESPLHHRINISAGASRVEIVGVVGHVKQWGLDADDHHSLRAQLYLPFMQLPDSAMVLTGSNTTVLVRAVPGAPPVSELIRGALRGMGPDLEISHLETMDQVAAGKLATSNAAAALLGAFALLALALAGIGIYGVSSYLVGQRTHEIGLRIALGARRADVLGMVLLQGTRTALAGAAAGLVAALGLTRLMSSLLYGVGPTDPATFAGVVAILAGVTLAACYLPAGRAAAIDPTVALRHD